MPGTYSQIYIQLIFSVKGRQNHISEEFKQDLQTYMGGIIQGKYVELIAVYCMPEHTHIFISLKPMIAISELVREVKISSTKFINEKQWLKGKFAWQEGFGVFSYSYSHIYNIVRYIEKQPAHHKTKKFKEEYTEFLHKFGLDYEERYLFDWI